MKKICQKGPMRLLMTFGGLLSGVTLPSLVMFLGDSETKAFLVELVIEGEMLNFEKEEKAFEVADFTDLSSLPSSWRGLPMQLSDAFMEIIFEI